MDQTPLVNEQVEMGARLLDRLVERIPIDAAFWMLRDEARSWEICFVCLRGDHQAVVKTYEVVGEVLENMPEPKPSTRDVTLIRLDSAIAEEVLSQRKHYPVRFRNVRVGHTDVEEAYVYPGLPNGRLLPRTRIFGLRADQKLGAGHVGDDIGVVDAVIGEVGFDQKFAELVKSRCGTVERFRAAYPQVVLEAVP